MSSRSKRKKDGRESFVFGEKPEEYFQYSIEAWNYENYLEDFKDGWNEAEAEYLHKEQQKEKEEDDWMIFQCSCPWLINDNCIATDVECTSKHRCAIWYLKEVMKGD